MKVTTLTVLEIFFLIKVLFQQEAICYVSVVQDCLVLCFCSFLSSLCLFSLSSESANAQWIFNTFLLNVRVLFKVILAHTEEDRLSPAEHHWQISLGHLNSVICTLWLQLFNQLLI